MGKNINVLDGLRGAACVLVMFSHAGRRGIFFEITNAGQLGVMLFFTLSGFLMAYLYSAGPYNLTTLLSYIIKRFFRVIPAYVFTITLAFLAVTVLNVNFYGMTLEEYGKHLMLVGINNVLWTVPVELRFYVLFPLIVLVVFASNRSKLMQSVLLGGMTLFTLIVNLSGPHYALWSYIEYFMIGVFIGYMYLQLQENPRALEWRGWNWVFGVGFGVLLLIAGLLRPLGIAEEQMWSASSGLAILMALIVFSAALVKGGIGRIFSHPAARFLGKISFSLYLLHNRILGVVMSFGLPKLLALLVFFAVSFAVSTAVFYIIENPFRRIGKKLADRVEKPGKGKSAPQMAG